MHGVQRHMQYIPVKNTQWIAPEDTAILYVYDQYLKDRCLQHSCPMAEPGADPGIYFGGGQTKVPNRKLRAKPESRARSA